MLTHARPTVWLAERAAAEGGLVPALRQLRRLGLADFSDVLLAMPDPEFPALSRALPAAGSNKALMHDSVSFLRVAAGALRDLSGRRPQGARILDAGRPCRLAPLLAYFSDPDSVESVDIGGPGTPGGAFDLIVSHSGFSGLSLRALDAAMLSLRRAVGERGVMAATVRPIEHWDFLAQGGDAEAASLRARHLQDGFAFRPAASDPERGEMSVDLEWFRARYPQWELRGSDRGWDELETALLLTPR